MKIAIPVRGNIVDDHFGHCEYFRVVTTNNQEVVESEDIPSPNGCGCKSQIIEVLKSKGVDVMLAGNIGQGAINKILAADIKLYRGCSGDVDTLIKAFLADTVEDQQTVCSPNGHNCSH